MDYLATMNELIDAIKQWPVIVQGALGSALFWVISVLAQKLMKLSTEHLSRRNKIERISWLISRDTKHEAFGGAKNYAQASHAVSSLVYRSLRPAYRGFLWLGLGLIASSISEIGVAIGGVGMVYYFLKAYEVVSPIGIEENTKEAQKKVRQELVKLGVYPEVILNDVDNKLPQSSDIND
jgi:hypothetical protein